MQIRDATGPAYTYLSTKTYTEGQDVTLHRHGAGNAALEHEHIFGRGQHRHEEAGEHHGGNYGAAFAGHRTPKAHRPGSFI